jgi:hypothetical protein
MADKIVPFPKKPLSWSEPPKPDDPISDSIDKLWNAISEIRNHALVTKGMAKDLFVRVEALEAEAAKRERKRAARARKKGKPE